MDLPSQTRITLHLDEDGVVVRCRGEIDLLTAPPLREAIDTALGLAATCWVDLRAVTFIDASGIRRLLDAHRAAVAREVCLLIAPPEDPLAMRPFTILGLLPFAYGEPRLADPAHGRFARGDGDATRLPGELRRPPLTLVPRSS